MTEDAPLGRADSEIVGALRPSPNHGPRLGVAGPDALILHYTGMADGASAIAWLCDPASGVSCHYVVEEDGTVLQLVAEGRRAWHAGRSSWAGEVDLNSRSVGIEIVNGGHIGGLPSYPSVQIEAVAALARDVVVRHGIAPARVLAHSDIAPDRKEDPGERFPWDRLAAAGVGLWVAPDDGQDATTLVPGDTGPAVLRLQQRCADYGYGLEPTGRYDAATTAVVRALQRHFRPARVDGRADIGTRRTLEALLRARAAAPIRGA